MIDLHSLPVSELVRTLAQHAGVERDYCSPRVLFRAVCTVLVEYGICANVTSALYSNASPHKEASYCHAALALEIDYVIVGLGGQMGWKNVAAAAIGSLAEEITITTVVSVDMEDDYAARERREVGETIARIRSGLLNDSTPQRLPSLHGLRL